MGSFSVTCGFSNLPISVRTETVLFFLSRTKKSSDVNSSVYSVTNSCPQFLPIFGTYNDYGSLERIHEDWNTAYITTKTEKSLDTLMKKLCDDSGVKLFKDKPSHQTTFVRKDIYDFFIEQKITHFRGDITLNNIIVDFVAFVKIVDEVIDKTLARYSDIFKGSLEERIAQLDYGFMTSELDTPKGAHNRFLTFFVFRSSYVGYFPIEDSFLNQLIDIVKDIKLGRLHIDDIILPAATFVKVFLTHAELRKSWNPSVSGTGSQDEEWAAMAAFGQRIHDIAEEELHKYDEGDEDDGDD